MTLYSELHTTSIIIKWRCHWLSANRFVIYHIIKLLFQIFIFLDVYLALQAESTEKPLYAIFNSQQQIISSYIHYLNETDEWNPKDKCVTSLLTKNKQTNEKSQLSHVCHINYYNRFMQKYYSAAANVSKSVDNDLQLIN